MKLMITGGHLTPALSLIESIETAKPEWNMVFVGRKQALMGDNTMSEEYRIILSKNIPFIGLSAGRLRRFLSIGTILSFFMIPVGCIRAFAIVLKQKPDCIVSFGGYIGFPIVFAGWLAGIPSVIHEQTTGVGIANRISSLFATRICVTNERAKTKFPKNKTIITGFPLRKSIFSPPDKPSFPVSTGRKIIYITGGATGSKSVNELFYPIVGKLLRTYTIVHQVGRSWISEAKKIRQGIRGDKRRQYIVCPYVDGSDHAWLLHHASLLVGRSGANTVAEVDACGIPAIFIPLPWSASNEQYENAQVLVEKHTAQCLDQTTLTPVLLLDFLLSTLNTVGLRDGKRIGRTDIHQKNAADRLLSVIAEFQA